MYICAKGPEKHINIWFRIKMKKKWKNSSISPLPIPQEKCPSNFKETKPSQDDSDADMRMWMLHPSQSHLVPQNNDPYE